MSLKLELITTDGVLLEEQVEEIIAMTESGEIGILNNHADLKTKLKPAPLRFKTMDSSEELVAVLGGILEVASNKVTVITEFAEKGQDIDETLAHEAAEKAKAELQTTNPDAKLSDRDLIIAEMRLQRELVRLQTAQLRRH